MFPTMFTLGNLVCGFFAIVVAARIVAPAPVSAPAGESVSVAQHGKVTLREDPNDPTNLKDSGWLILLAMVFDALDGYVARLAKTSSDFGAQLDSLCDLVTFGVAPGFLLVKMCPQFAFLHREAVWVIAASYVACAALRLARFNVETAEDDDHMHFSGLPSPAAAAAIAGFAIMFHTLRAKEDNPLMYAQHIDWALQMALPAFGLLVALLMVSRIPYPHAVNQILRGQRTFAHLVAVVFAVVAVAVIRNYSLPIICGAFVFYGPVRFCWEKVVQRRRQEESLF
jgi:CDP-diacylglycerol--serine O-phosphatidyltransferase